LRPAALSLVAARTLALALGPALTPSTALTLRLTLAAAAALARALGTLAAAPGERSRPADHGGAENQRCNRFAHGNNLSLLWTMATLIQINAPGAKRDPPAATQTKYGSGQKWIGENYRHDRLLFDRDHARR
jgi:hypothetical protein